ncbi:MAG: alanine dehydrogenase [bacterium]|nr:alanine dehydrogenase [bacterium]
MKIGVPKEIKIHEYRVGLVPSSVHELTRRGHKVVVESGAGLGCGFSDETYQGVGAEILSSAAQVFDTADMIVKVKEPQSDECKMLKEGQVLFTYLHLAADKPQAEGLIASKSIAIAYETVTADRGGLPLLAPMSEVAGRMSVQVGAVALQKASGGSGVLLGGVPGVPSGNVVVIGGGVVGSNAASMAVGLGANVTIIDRSVDRLRELDVQFGNSLKTLYSTFDTIESAVSAADLVVGAVLVPGAAAPKLVTKEMLKKMKPGAVLVDVAIDQGGCFETSHPTTHDDPTYIVDTIVHYCVANMPGGVCRTSAFALNNVTLPFVLALADKGYKKAL